MLLASFLGNSGISVEKPTAENLKAVEEVELQTVSSFGVANHGNDASCDGMCGVNGICF
jgi:hypothetical protein